MESIRRVVGFLSHTLKGEPLAREAAFQKLTR